MNWPTTVSWQTWLQLAAIGIALFGIAGCAWAWARHKRACPGFVGVGNFLWKAIFGVGVGSLFGALCPGLFPGSLLGQCFFSDPHKGVGVLIATIFGAWLGALLGAPCALGAEMDGAVEGSGKMMTAAEMHWLDFE